MWHNSDVTIFVESFILPILVILFTGGLLLKNPLNLDAKRRWAIGIVIAFTAFALPHAIREHATLPADTSQQGVPVQRGENGIVVLVANFDGPDPEKYRVTEHLIAALRKATQPFPDVHVVALGDCITEQQGGALAREKAKQYEASLALWGWYGKTVENVNLRVHIEFVRRPPHFPFDNRGKNLITSSDSLDSFVVQQELSGELSYVVLVAVGLLKYGSKDYTGAIQSLSSALEQVSEQSTLMLSKAPVLFHRGNAHVRTEDWDEAIRDFTLTIESLPDEINAYLNRGNAFQKQGLLDNAVLDYDEVLKRQPEHLPALLGKASALDLQARFEEALITYEKILSLDPHSAHAYNNRGNVYFKRGDIDRAIEDYTRAIKLDSTVIEPRKQRAQCYMKRQRYADAVKDYTTAIRIDPSDYKLYCMRGLARMSMQNWAIAAKDFRAALDISPRDIQARIELAGLYVRLNRDRDAINELNTVIVFEPNHGQARYLRATLHEAKGQNGLALADYQAAVKLNTEDVIVRKCRERIRALTLE